jgi:hypothetical protein
VIDRDKPPIGIYRNGLTMWRAGCLPHRSRLPPGFKLPNLDFSKPKRNDGDKS